MRQLIEIVVRIVAPSQVKTTASPHSEGCCSPFSVATPIRISIGSPTGVAFYSATGDADRHQSTSPRHTQVQTGHGWHHR